MTQEKQKLPRRTKTNAPKAKKEKAPRALRARPPKPPKQKKEKPEKLEAAVVLANTAPAQADADIVASKGSENEKKQQCKKTGKLKNIIIAVLVVALVVESAVLVFGKKNGSSDNGENGGFVLNLDMSGIGGTMLNGISKTAENAVNDIKSGIQPKLDILPLIEKTVFSDSIVNTVMSMSYPLLFKVLTDLDMMDFAENVSLYPTPVALSALFENKGYSCLTTDGQRKPLFEVLAEADKDWGYMDDKVALTDSEGNYIETAIWNTIVWGVKDRDSFFTAMNDMSEGIRGVLEVCLQGKEKNVNINLVDFLLKTDKVNIGLDAAKVYNGSPASGYELCIIPLFTMLGLTEGEYKTVEEFCGYTNISDMWRGILEPIFSSVEKIMKNPLPSLCNLLLNFVDSIESGTLVEGMKSLRMDASFHTLAKTVMKFEDGLLFNLGEALVDIIGSTGIKLNGSFNGILDSLVQTVLKNPSIDLPDMDIAALKECGTQTALPGGGSVWVADEEKITEYLIGYALQGEVIDFVLSLTPLAGTPEAARITASVEKSREGLIELVDVVLDSVLKTLPA